MGLILSIIIAVVVALIAAYIIYESSNYYSSDLEFPKKVVKNGETDDRYKERLARYRSDVKECISAWFCLVVVPFVIGIVVLCGCFYIGYRTNVATCKSLEAKVITYEAAVNNDSIGGAEKLSLVGNVASINAQILQIKEVANKWYGFMVPDDLAKELHIIDLSKIE